VETLRLPVACQQHPCNPSYRTWRSRLPRSEACAASTRRWRRRSIAASEFHRCDPSPLPSWRIVLACQPGRFGQLSYRCYFGCDPADVTVACCLLILDHLSSWSALLGAGLRRCALVCLAPVGEFLLTAARLISLTCSLASWRHLEGAPTAPLLREESPMP